VGGLILCVGVFFLFLGVLIGASILCGACALYNKFVGGKRAPESVPEPDLGKAMGITFVCALVQLLVGFIFGLVVNGTLTSAASGRLPLPRWKIEALTTLFSLPVGLLILSGMVSSMLPTSFPRGILVALCFYLILIIIAAVLLGIVALFGLASLLTR
jgi:hypothetical protein